MKEWKLHSSLDCVESAEILQETDEKPWNKTKHFHMEDVDGTINITLADAIYIQATNLKPRIQNQIREMAAFSNPIFYKNQAMGLSNYDNSRYIYLGHDENGYICIPRGLLEQLLENCKKAMIPIKLEDKRCRGSHMKVSFNGQLKESQVLAVKAMEKSDTGILNAATAFGKTVVCCDMIARKQVNTLILIQSSALMEQWMKALEQFLIVDEEAPEYQTLSGRTRKRKSVIGKLQGAHDSTTGLIDIAMVGSICKKGEYHNRLKEYGMVILNECHHAASDTIVDVLQEVCAKYVYGVTATPFRGDGLEKINYMLLGPIRYKFTSKDRAKEQGIAHLVYPRFTRAVAPRFANDKMHPNEAYTIIRENADRDELIIHDVKKCIDEGRTPVILSKYVDHSKRLYEKLNGYADKTFLLSGNHSKKEHRDILQQMNEIQSYESMILIATGKLIGEGFDFPRLDTLIMATPVAWKGVVEQYAGRLNRDYDGKQDVIIYDYVDSHIPMFDRMYYKRLKAYKQIGYSIYSENTTAMAEDSNEINAIFDIDTYLDVYQNDLLLATKEIIISSPVISGKRVDELSKLLQEKMRSGIRVNIVTWKPDLYGYGDAEYNLMRVCSNRIASKLLELTFGKER